MGQSKRDYSDFVMYYSNLWLEECIQKNNVANEHELYITTLCDTIVDPNVSKNVGRGLVFDTTSCC